MNIHRTLLAALALVIWPCVSASAQSYSVLHQFTRATGTPHAGLVQGPDGELYGITFAGDHQYGAIYKIHPDGSGFTVLKSFASPGWSYGDPQGGLVLSGATLFGTTADTSYGTVFKINTDGSGFEILKQFTGSDGSGPYGRLALAGSTLYGTTMVGGAAWQGTVYKLSTSGGDFAVLKSFSGGHDGGLPQAGLVVVADGWLYGTTSTGGSNGFGTVFRIDTAANNFAGLKHFNGFDGRSPTANLLLFDTTLYGTTYYGGQSDAGTFFKLRTNGEGFRVLKDFGGAAGANPVDYDLVIFGNLLCGITGAGGTNDSGTLYCLNTDGGDYTVLKHFSDTGGSYPWGGLLLSGAAFYGVTSHGGNADAGVLFRFSFAPRVELPKLVDSGTSFSFSWLTSAGQSYTVQSNDDLTTTNWFFYTNFSGSGGWTRVEVPVTSAPRRFFRVR